MLVCPDCLVPLPDLGVDCCGSCGWELRRRDGVPDLLSSHDRRDPLFARYAANYDAIARGDLTASIQDPAYLETSTDDLVGAAGDVRGLSVCDVGVGQGRLVDRLLAAGARAVTAVDIAAPYLRQGLDHRIRLIQANAERLPFTEEFDVVVASAVLEHVLNAGDLLLSAHRALVPGGRLVVKVPYRESLVSYAHQAGCGYDFVHLRSFERATLRVSLEGAGFRVERLTFDGYIPERLRSSWTGRARPQRVLRRILRRYPARADLLRMDDRLGRLLFVPNEMTVVARRR